MKTRSKPRPVRFAKRGAGLGDGLGAVPHAHDARAGFLQHGAGKQRVDVVVLGKQNGQAFRRRARKHGVRGRADVAASIGLGLRLVEIAEQLR